MAIYEREVVAMIMYGYGNDPTYNLVVIIIGICVGLLLMIFYGYLFNYYIIKELREMNRNIKDLNDTLGYGLKNVCMSNQAQPKQHYQMRNNTLENYNQDQSTPSLFLSHIYPNYN